MYHRYLIVFFFSIVYFNTGNCIAQKTLTEGVLVYNVVMDAPAGQDGVKPFSGTYTISIKGSQVRKELKLNNGFETVLVTDHANQQAFSLKKMGGKDVAIQIDFLTLENRKKKYARFAMKMLSNTKQVASLNAEEATITYENANTINIFCSKDWQLPTDVFEHFPGMKELPVIFAYTNEEGPTTHFTLDKITPMPVENAAFVIPAHTKIISSEEYKEAKK